MIKGLSIKETGGNVVEINGKKYIPLDSVSVSKKVEKDYVVVRTQSAGVFAGNLVKRNGKEVEMKNARRLWYWNGAASLSQLAMDGVANPNSCKFPCEVTRIILTEAIEIIPCTEQARISIRGVAIWKK